MNLYNENSLTAFLFFFPFIFFGFLMLYFQKKYLKLYRKIKDPKYPILQEEISEYFVKNPGKWFLIAPVVLFKVLGNVWHKESNIELENAAKKFRISIILFVLSIPFSFTIVILLS